jgi:RNA polymerase-interacting CarD/CdnL/TRCF family regulator
MYLALNDHQIISDRTHLGESMKKSSNVPSQQQSAQDEQSMTQVDLELKEGDWIVHASHGLGRITGMDAKEFQGDKRAYYVVKTSQITYWLPVADSASARIRPISSPDDFSEALDQISDDPQPLSEAFRKRLEYIRQQVDSCSLMRKAALIRDLHARNVQRDIHINEKKILEKLESQFVDEWVIACRIEPETAWNKMRTALKKSCANLKNKKPLFS